MIAENITNINTNLIIISEPIKNNIIPQSFFYKIIYSNNFITLNGLYILFELKNYSLNKEKIYFNTDYNVDIINKLIAVERSLFNKLKLNKNVIMKISDLLNNGYIKYCLNDYDSNHNSNINSNNNSYINNEDTNKIKIVLKISGIWESKENCGITFKFILVNDYLKFLTW